ncbi:hypothetical protein ACWERY_35900 [Streptomyces sp. NPDC004082]|uniref:hypothetical protein n=1 Tax=unclassified Streptomyces TaxID=2593676 RepID=UPI0033A48796
MAKNKNRKQGAAQDRSTQPDQAPEHTRSTATEAAQLAQVQGSPADVARKHQKRFGHN